MVYRNEKNKDRVVLKVGYKQMTLRIEDFLKEKGIYEECLVTSKRGVKSWNSKIEIMLDSSGIFDTKPGSENRIHGCIHETFEYDGNEYFVASDQFGSEIVFKLLPKLHNDENFKWKHNKKYGVNECRLAIDLYEFHCVANENGDVKINVIYCKCDNKHKNKVTVNEILVCDATNSIILDAIRYWKNEALTEIDKLKIS